MGTLDWFMVFGFDRDLTGICGARLEESIDQLKWRPHCGSSSLRVTLGKDVQGEVLRDRALPQISLAGRDVSGSCPGIGIALLISSRRFLGNLKSK